MLALVPAHLFSIWQRVSNSWMPHWTLNLHLKEQATYLTAVYVTRKLRLDWVGIQLLVFTKVLKGRGSCRDFPRNVQDALPVRTVSEYMVGRGDCERRM